MFVLGNAKKSVLSRKEKDNKYYDDKYDIDLNNSNDSHSIIVNQSLKYKNILDVGCGPGFIGKKIKSVSDKKNCCVDGIEIDNISGEIAKKYYNNVYICSIENENNKIYNDFMNNNKKYDCIIMADLIEHLDNPGEIINKLSKKLSKDGVFLISTPNIAHIDIISNLINGNFNYNTTGILDSTHKCFFTKNSFYDFVDNINETYNLKYGVDLIGCTYAKNEKNCDKFVSDVIGNEIYIFQNIFIVGKNIKTKRKKSKDYYKMMNDLYDNSKIIAYENEIAAKNNEIAAKNNEIEFLKNEINAIKSSNSWKITEPLRTIKRVIKTRRIK